MKHDTVLVSVYIVTMNRLNLFQRALESVLCQDYNQLEIIIVDNGSSDGTVEYIRSLADFINGVRIVSFLLPENKGACYARNYAIKNANGHFITGLDDDDYFTPNRISAFMSNYDSKYAFIFADDIFFKSDVERYYKKSVKLPIHNYYH